MGQDEIKLFLFELDGHGYEFKDKTHVNGIFTDDTLNMVWEMWKASAARYESCDHDVYRNNSGGLTCIKCGNSTKQW